MHKKHKDDDIIHFLSSKNENVIVNGPLNKTISYEKTTSSNNKCGYH